MSPFGYVLNKQKALSRGKERLFIFYDEKPLSEGKRVSPFGHVLKQAKGAQSGERAPLYFAWYKSFWEWDIPG
jgi:hypothetical protein